ncbi:MULTISPECIES: hypothetical protein [Aeromonas]|jgi:hypothetical protein|uniref:hypothetical protein n=1 Tax=Aeromonas TaxID=642 RepID=UPI0022556349|nr:hypothetical protein [Aeromonas hydrophila]MCX4117359.1 hypothetical protein [Aeromonas hydrophila]
MGNGQEKMTSAIATALGAKCPQSLVRDLSNFLEKQIVIEPSSPLFDESFKALSADVYQMAVSRRHLLLNEFKYLLSKQEGFTQGAVASEVVRIATENNLCPAGRAGLFGNTLLAWSDGTSTAKVWGIKAAMLGLTELKYEPQTSTIKILMAHACDLLNDVPDYLASDPAFPVLVEMLTLGRNVFYNNEI